MSNCYSKLQNATTATTASTATTTATATATTASTTATTTERLVSSASAIDRQERNRIHPENLADLLFAKAARQLEARYGLF